MIARTQNQIASLYTLTHVANNCKAIQDEGLEVGIPPQFFIDLIEQLHPDDRPEWYPEFKEREQCRQY